VAAANDNHIERFLPCAHARLLSRAGKTRKR
jgi:hypothetical protein